MGLIKTIANALRTWVGFPVKPARKKPRRRKTAAPHRSNGRKAKPLRLKKASSKRTKGAVKRKSMAAPKRLRKPLRAAAAKAKAPVTRTTGERPAPTPKSGRLPARSVKPKRILVGEVTHYFDRAGVAAFMVTGAPVLLGDRLEFEGSQGPLTQKVLSLQINRNPVKKAVMGDEVGLKVSGPVKEGDRVFKLL